MARRLIVAMFFAVVSVGPWYAQEVFAQTDVLLRPITEGVAAAATTRFAADDQTVAQVPREVLPTPGKSRSTPLIVTMHATTLAAQALDMHSTLKALNAGAVEANPVMRGLVNNKAAFISVKAAMGAGLMYATHKMAKRNKVAAIVTAAAVNSAYLVVAHHNYKVASSLP